MKDRNVQYPNRYRLQKVSGTDDIYDLVPVPGTVTEEGTFLNKATLLKDSTAALYGLDGGAVPDDALKSIATALSGSVKIETGSYVGTGTFGQSNPNSLTFGFVPKIVIVGGLNPSSYGGWVGDSGAGGGGFMYVFGQASTTTAVSNVASALKFSLSGTTLTWYTSSTSNPYGSGQQLNYTNHTYSYIAIG